MAATRLDNPLGTHEFDDIIAGTAPSPLITSIELDASEGPIVRGTVVTAKSADGKFKPVSEALTTGDIVYIIADDVEKAESGDVATAYKTGNFVKGRLVTDGEYELTAADFEFLRDAGIQTTGMIEVADSEYL